jgi:hypothetical protein
MMPGSGKAAKQFAALQLHRRQLTSTKRVTFFNQHLTSNKASLWSPFFSPPEQVSQG